MSFDVYLHSDDGDAVYWFNYTHNVNPIVERCLLSVPQVPTGKDSSASYSWSRLDGWKASAAAPILRSALALMSSPLMEADLKAMEPPNKWGSLCGVLKVTAEFYQACLDHPDAVISTHG